MFSRIRIHTSPAVISAASSGDPPGAGECRRNLQKRPMTRIKTRRGVAAILTAPVFAWNAEQGGKTGAVGATARHERSVELRRTVRSEFSRSVDFSRTHKLDQGVSSTCYLRQHGSGDETQDARRGST